jgi:hypothetical protein
MTGHSHIPTRDVRTRWLMSGAVVLVVMALGLTACGGEGGANETGALGEPWQFGGNVPDSVTVPIPDGGEVVSRLEMSGRVVVMLAYPGNRLTELVAFYDLELNGPAITRSEHSIIAETEAVWMVRWRHPDLEVRVVECMDRFTRSFSQACVAVEQFTSR